MTKPTQDNSPLGASPDAVAWRLTAVEREVKNVSLKIDNIASGFATHKDVEVAKEQARLEHEAIYEKIGDVSREVDTLKKRSWIQNALSAIFGGAVAILVADFLNDIMR